MVGVADLSSFSPSWRQEEGDTEHQVEEEEEEKKTVGMGMKKSVSVASGEKEWQRQWLWPIRGYSLAVTLLQHSR